MKHSQIHKNILKEILFSFAFMSILISCNNENTGNILNLSDEKVAVEIFSHVKRVESIETLNNSDYEEFLTPGIRSQISMDKSTVVQMSNVSENYIDTIHSLSELPVVKEIVSSNIIYVSGVMVTERQDITPEEENILNMMTATPLLPENTIKKVVSKNGMLISYGSYGNILSSEPYEEPNMKPFLDSLKHYIELAEQESSNKSSEAQSLFTRIKSGNLPTGMNIWQMENGNVVIEETINSNAENGMRLKSINIDGEMRSRTITNPNMDKTLRFELYQGNQMVSRRTYQYNGSEKLKNSVKIKGRANENPSGVISEVLIVNKRGIPKIRKTQEEYKQNQMIVHL